MSNYRYLPFALFALSPWCSSPLALAIGMGLSLLLQWELPSALKNWGKICMQISIVGLGFALDPRAVQKAGLQSVVVTFVSLLGIMLLAFFVSRLLQVKGTTGSLIAAGTGIAAAEVRSRRCRRLSVQARRRRQLR